MDNVKETWAYITSIKNKDDIVAVYITSIKNKDDIGGKLEEPRTTSVSLSPFTVPR